MDEVRLEKKGWWEGGEGEKGAQGVRFMPTCLKVFRSLGFFSPPSFSSFSSPPPLTVGAVCGRRGVGWISRKGGRDAQTEGEKGEVQSSLTLRRTVMADSGGVGLDWKG